MSEVMLTDGHLHSRDTSGYLEVTDVANGRLRYLPVSG